LFPFLIRGGNSIPLLDKEGLGVVQWLPFTVLRQRRKKPLEENNMAIKWSGAAL